jgi:hypothetical protein
MPGKMVPFLRMQLAVLVFSVLVACLPIPDAPAQDRQLPAFDALMTALNAGSPVRAVIHYGKCKLFSDGAGQEKSPDAIGGMAIDAYEFFAPNTVRNDKAFVVFSTAKLIQNPKGEGFAYNYVKVRVNADNTVKITAQYVNASTYKVFMDEYFLGLVNDGKNDGGVFFYKQ